MLSFHVPREDHEAPSEPGTLPPWRWTVTWEETDPRYIALPKELFWPRVWLRMGSTQHRITAATIERADAERKDAGAAITARWQSLPDHPGISPVWSWSVTWTATGEDWEGKEDDVLWYEAWQRMIAEHGFITPAELSRRPTPSGWMSYEAAWESRNVPGEGVVMPQTQGCYAVWHKVAAPWGAGQAPSCPVPRRRPDAPW